MWFGVACGCRRSGIAWTKAIATGVGVRLRGCGRRCEIVDMLVCEVVFSWRLLFWSCFWRGGVRIERVFRRVVFVSQTA